MLWREKRTLVLGMRSYICRTITRGTRMERPMVWITSSSISADSCDQLSKSKVLNWRSSASATPRYSRVKARLALVMWMG
jgi:hypothetical protein